MVGQFQPGAGGWPEGRLQLSTFIQNYLSSGEESWAYDIYRTYKKAAQDIPLRRGKRARRVISYHGFLNYMWMLRRLGLITYLRDREGEIDTEEAVDKSGAPAPHLAPKHFIRADMGKINDPAWGNPHKALYG